MKIDKQELANLLTEAKQAHHKYEKTLEGKDENWAQWYAEYISDHVSS